MLDQGARSRSGQLANALLIAEMKGCNDYESALVYVQGESMMGRDLTRGERNLLRAMFGLGREVSET